MRDSSFSHKTSLFFLFCFLVCLIGWGVLWSIGQGHFQLNWFQAGQLLIQKGSLWLTQDVSAWNPQTEEIILFQLRLPRILMALALGAALGVAGVAMQGLFRNPLADPSLIGVSSGAALGAAMSLLGEQYFFFVEPHLSLWLLSIHAFLGGVLSTFLVYHFSQAQGRIILSWMLLIGMTLSTFAGALIGFFSYFSSNEALKRFTFWSLGSLTHIQAESVMIMVCVLVFCFWGLLRESRALDALCLGELEASTLGVSLKWLKLKIIFFTALLIGVSVALCGTIGFVSLMIPHFMRLLIGARHRVLFIFSALCGGLLLLVADTLARTILDPIEIPVGILTALLGVPFFLVLFIQKKQHLY